MNKKLRDSEMKKPKEYLKEWSLFGMLTTSELYEIVKRVQKDAYKAGKKERVVKRVRFKYPNEKKKLYYNLKHAKTGSAKVAIKYINQLESVIKEYESKVN